VTTPRTLPLTVLLHEGPIGRAYLLQLERDGVRPAAVVRMVARTHPVTRRPLGRWLPGSFGLAYAERAEEASRMHWPRAIRRSVPAVFDAVRSALERWRPGSTLLLDRLADRIDDGTCADRVIKVRANGPRDRAVVPALREAGQPIVLFTGGGIVPPAVLDAGIRFLHVHPGYLPYVRGADGLLWSTLVRGRPGATSFFLDRGLDTGPVVCAREYEPVTFALPFRPDDQTLYRSVYSWYDPLLRAACLSDTIAAHPDFALVAGEPQNPRVGETYPFMHSRLRRAALDRIFWT